MTMPYETEAGSSKIMYIPLSAGINHFFYGDMRIFCPFITISLPTASRLK